MNIPKNMFLGFELKIAKYQKYHFKFDSKKPEICRTIFFLR